MTHEAALALVELQTAGVVTGVAEPSTPHDRRRVYLTDAKRVSEVVEVFSPEPVTIRPSPWSASEWLDAGAALDQLQHLVGFADEVDEDAPRMLLWMTRVDPHDAALLERLQDGIFRLRQVLVQPMNTWPG